MRHLLSITRLLRGVAIVAIAANVIVAAPAVASAKTIKKFANYCVMANRPVAQMSNARNTLVLLCRINEVRKQNHLPALHLTTELTNSAGGHADRSVAVRWWDMNDGLSSHVDPGTGTSPADRIAAAGYCPAGNRSTSEITFASYGTGGQYPPTANGAIDWWMDDPPHREVLLDRSLRDVGPVARPGFAFPGTVYGPSGTFVVDFGSCG